MKTYLTPLVVALSLLTPGRGSCVDEVREDEKGTYFGALFAAHSSKSAPARKGGAVITHVLPDSPAARADLRRNDVVLVYDRENVRDANHLARLIQTDRSGRKVPLVILRGEKKATVEVTLALGPALKLAYDDPEPPRTARAPAVSLRVTPLDTGKIRWTIEYGTNDGKKVVTCEGAEKELTATLAKLPERERQLVRIALERLKALEGVKK